MSLDNSSCNLASLNLMKFLKADGSFDAKTFAKASDLIITAMDISICFADFPTEAIGDTTRAYRQLGIGYANLGALLMASGLAYDSEGGRALAGAITSLLTGTTYKRSAELAGIVGPYAGFAQNAKPHARVMRKHAAASSAAKQETTLDIDVWAEANKAWDACLSIGEKNGWRNAQISVLAPTGTIGLMMDCDTTGIEPDFSLVKFKKLVGGGSMQIVNQTVPQALRKLGYTEETVEAIVEFIAANGHVIDAPGLKQEHYEVFDCALGARSIAPMGHVRMMAACQPFLSGAISKTVNLPEDATVEEVEEVHLEAWRMGIKALAVYRDNCKVGQPLSDGKAKKKDVVAEVEIATPVRKRLPKSRPATTTSFSVGGAEGYMTAGAYADGALGEVFLKLGKQGSTLAGVMDAFSIAVSIGLQYGVPLETFVEKFTNLRFEPAGMTDDADIRIAQSMMDYIFRRLALDYLPFEQRSAMGLYTSAERAAALDNGGEYAPVSNASSASADIPKAPTAAAAAAPAAVKPEAPKSVAVKIEAAPAAPLAATIGSSSDLLESMGIKSDAPMCMTCGVKMRMSGACFVCEGCGNTSGCS
jgi:ribonucleoside-diphosphate reductase alpha chain